MASDYEIPETPMWWEVQNIPTALIRELRRRKNSNNIGFNFPASGDPSKIVYNFYDNHAKYKGPMTPWVRIFSNGTGNASNGTIPRSKILDKKGKPPYNGFILTPGVGFYDAFGYKQNGNVLAQSNAIIGYEADGTPHYIDPSFRSQYNYKWDSEFGQKTEVPSVLTPPNLESIEIKTSKDMLAFGSFKFKCYSLAQLEYLAPFFLTPRINVFIEMGWNLYNIDSIINLNDMNECWNIIKTPQTAVDRWYKSYGNYGCISGIITKYNFSTQDGMVYDCNVELTSRQALFAGMPAENNVSTTVTEIKNTNNKQIPVETKEYAGLKTFLKINLPKLKQAVIARSNFMTYVQSSKADSETTYEGNITKAMASKNFYNDKPENRVFIGRSDANEVYKNPNIPNQNGNIAYVSNDPQYKPVSFIDTNDFDAKSNDEVWIQLGFLFEIFNQYCAVAKSKTFLLDYDKVINAHPNLISCDKHVLIPNGVAPKINIGKFAPNSANLTEKDAQTGGYLPANSDKNNAFLKSRYDINVDSTDDDLYIASKKAQNVFKTAGAYRDNLDTVINRLYYDIQGLNESSPTDNISFPFIADKNVELSNTEQVLTDPTLPRQKTIKRTYRKYRYGYLKNLYISKTKILEMVDNKDINTLQQFINAVLTTINDATNGFWKLQVSQNDTGGLAILDNNYVDLGEKAPNLKEVYVFDLGGTESCIKTVTMDTSLTSEQATLTLFQAGQNAPDNSKSVMSQRNSVSPNTSMVDRFDSYNTTDDGTGENNEPPSRNEITVDQNPLIAKMQTYGQSDGVLMVTSAYLRGDEDPSVAEKNFKQLNLSTDLKDKLSQIIDDNDTQNNLPLYSGISPNFSLTITFDGIFGFRMFQHFGISNLPKPYVPDNVIFMITDVTHYVTQGNGKWETVVGCLARCVQGQKIKLIPV